MGEGGGGKGGDKLKMGQLDQKWDRIIEQDNLFTFGKHMFTFLK